MDMDPPILVFEWILIFAGHGGQEGTARQEDSGAVPQNGVCTIGTSLYLVYHRNLSSKIYQIRILQNRETLERTCYNLRDEVKELDSKVEYYVLVFQETLCLALNCVFERWKTLAWKWRTSRAPWRCKVLWWTSWRLQGNSYALDSRPLSSCF